MVCGEAMYFEALNNVDVFVVQLCTIEEVVSQRSGGGIEVTPSSC